MLICSETILFPVSICMFKVNSKNVTNRCEIFPKLTKKTTRTTSIAMDTHQNNVNISELNFKLVNVSLEFY